MNGTNVTKIQNGVHFKQNFGSIHFDDLQRQADLSLNPVADNVPEFEQHYIIHLFNVTGMKTISLFLSNDGLKVYFQICYYHNHLQVNFSMLARVGQLIYHRHKVDDFVTFSGISVHKLI